MKIQTKITWLLFMAHCVVQKLLSGNTDTNSRPTATPGILKWLVIITVNQIVIKYKA